MGKFSIPDGITTIGRRAFRSCNLLTFIHIPDSVTEIGEEAFFGCPNLTDLRIPESVTKIDDFAFVDCDALTDIYIPTSVVSIGIMAFEGCDNLTCACVPATCSIGDRAFPERCEIVSLQEYRRRLAVKLADARAGDGVDVVGMHSPEAKETMVDCRCGRAI